MTQTEAVFLERKEGSVAVRGRDYWLTVRLNRPRAILTSSAGQVWAQLSLIASVDRLDRPDEAYALQPVRVEEISGDLVAGETVGGEVRLVFESASTAWESRTVTLRCTPDAVRVSVTVRGNGLLSEVTLLGGRAVLASGASGVFRSGTEFASVFVPTPTEPVAVVRPASAAAQLGVVGDAEPGRLHGIFSPPPLCFAFGRQQAAGATRIPDGDWLGVSLVAPVQALTFTTLRYDPLDGGFLVRLAYEGHSRVAGEWTSPELVLRPAAGPFQAIADYRDDLILRDWAPAVPIARAAWWDEPIFCGWGAQCAEAAALSRADVGVPVVAPDGFILPAMASLAPDLARQSLYDRWLDRLQEHELSPGTIVIDDRWQADYGTNTVDTEKWPDLRGWIRQRHEAGQRVLLWFKAWDAHGLPAELCVRDAAGNPVAADPSNPRYLQALHDQVVAMLSPDGLDADGFKVDFTQRTPSGAALVSHGDAVDGSLEARDGDGGGVWGIAALHALISTIHTAAHEAKPDALVVTHAVHPSFGGVSDMVRLNDVLEHDAQGALVPVVDQLRFRHAVAAAALPAHPIDTDQWPMPNR
ncbi:MAG: hypothetical protein ACYCZK_00890, partial [Microbacteriaceae bacterium]